MLINEQHENSFSDFYSMLRVAELPTTDTELAFFQFGKKKNRRANPIFKAHMKKRELHTYTKVAVHDLKQISMLLSLP